jgi:hypothetical protein
MFGDWSANCGIGCCTHEREHGLGPGQGTFLVPEQEWPGSESEQVARARRGVNRKRVFLEWRLEYLPALHANSQPSGAAVGETRG